MTEASGVKNQTLYERFRDFAEKSFTVLNTYLETLPYETKQCIMITEGGGGSDSIGYTPCFWGFIETYKDDITKLPEFASCIETIRQDNSVYKDIETADFLIQFLTKLAREKEFFEVDIKRYLDKFHKIKNDLFRFNADGFNKIYSRYEKYLYSDRQIIAFAPLRGFELESEEIDLGNYFKIKKMSADELTELWYDYDVLSTFLKAHSYRTNVTASVKSYIVTEQIGGDVRQEFDTIVTSLRLWKKGDVGYDTIYYLPKWRFRGGRINGSTSIFFGSPPVVLKLIEIEEFKKFYRKFKDLTISNYEFLRTAINRFNYTYERKRREDKLVDCMISFEALFSEGPGDLSYKVPIRAARLLETEFHKREKIRENMKEGYNGRSKIVHGNKSVKKFRVKLSNDETRKVPLLEFVPIIKDYLRRSIKQVMSEIDSGKDKKKILAEIDFTR